MSFSKPILFDYESSWVVLTDGFGTLPKNLRLQAYWIRFDPRPSDPQPRVSTLAVRFVGQVVQHPVDISTAISRISPSHLEFCWLCEDFLVLLAICLARPPPKSPKLRKPNSCSHLQLAWVETHPELLTELPATSLVLSP